MTNSEEPRATSIASMPIERNQNKSCFQKYGEAWKTLIPIRFGKEKDKAAIPHSNLGLISFASLSWMSKIMWKASRQGIEKEDLQIIREKESVEVNGKRFDRIWNKEMCERGLKKASLAKAVWRLNRTCLLIAGFAMISLSIFQIAGPALILKAFFDYLGDNTSPMINGFYLVAALSLSQCLRNVSFSILWIVGTYAGVRAQAALQMTIYNKVLTIRSVGEELTAQVLNFCTSDMERILQAMQYSIMLVGAPIMWTINLLYCYIIMGPWSLLGNFLVLAYFPIMAFVGKKTSQYRMKSVKITDRRIRLMNQVLSNIKFIKMYAWEETFSRTIENIRSEEESVLAKACFLQSAGWTAPPIVGVICPLSSFIGHVLCGGHLTASVAFTVLSQYTSLYFVVTTVPIAVKALSEGIASCRRIQKMLLVPDVTSPSDETIKDPKKSISICEADFAWPTKILKQQGSSKSKIKINTKESKNKITLKSQSRSDLCNSNITLSESKNNVTEEQPELTTIVTDVQLCVAKGMLIGICGNVGSGKSTLLAGISGEATISKGKVNVHGPVALVTQQAWLFNATLRDNIIFGLPYIEHKYNMIVDVCSLSTDFSLLPNGDQTEIGEKGSNLSGGQKQRVNLARALYSDRDIYLLDDVLSAVDAKVAMHIFENCIQTAMKEKTVLLVTHAMHLLEKCDYVLLMKNGKITEKGTHQELIRNGQEYQALFTFDKTERDNMKGRSDPVENAMPKDNIIVEEKGPLVDAILIKDEIDLCKKITWDTCLYYAKACGGYCSIILMFTTVILFNVAIMFNHVWLQTWLDAGDGNKGKSRVSIPNGNFPWNFRNKR